MQGYREISTMGSPRNQGHWAVRLFKRMMFLLPPFRYAGSTVLMVFER